MNKLLSLNLFDIPAASLLIIYDAEYFEKLENEVELTQESDSFDNNSLNKVKIKIVDFSFYKFQQETNEIEGKIHHTQYQESNISDKKMLGAIRNFISIISNF
jgi:hypothetical protein